MSDFVPSVASSYRDLMSNWTTGVSIVTAYDGRKLTGCTISSLTSVSLEPPLLLIGLDRQSRMFNVLMESRRFCVNILSNDQAHLSPAFSSPVDHAQRFAGVETSRVLETPVIAGCVANAVCEVNTEFVVGDRVLVLGQPLQHLVDPSRTPLTMFRRSLGVPDVEPGRRAAGRS